ncbi:hypothetical protein DFJ63DRAFT_312590 [Scheffersomyces coipomensis]|uniref:uncharacterized protein n=1 Tax=Scheffersomyces coipomensis TaxID=1788519 RepID=UPI00315CE71B
MSTIPRTTKEESDEGELRDVSDYLEEMNRKLRWMKDEAQLKADTQRGKFQLRGNEFKDELNFIYVCAWVLLIFILVVDYHSLRILIKTKILNHTLSEVIGVVYGECQY